MRVRRIFCLLILVSSSAMAAETSPSSEKIIAQRVQEMFQIGFVRGPRETQESQRLYDSLRNASGSISKVDYAHGLISLRQMKNKDAQNDFLVATKRPGAPYLPAWEALIWSHFVARENDVAYERLLEFSKLVQKSEDLTDLMRHEQFYWMGRIMAAAELTSESAHRRERWARCEKQLTDLLGGDAIDAYRGGKEEMNIRHAMLDDEARQTQALAKAKEAAQRDKKLARVEKSLEAADQKREALQKSAAEMKESLEEQTAETKKQIERSEKDYTFLERRAMTLMTSMMSIDKQIGVLQSRTGSRASNESRDQALGVLMNMRSGYELEYLRIAGLAQQTSANAQMLTEQQGQSIDQYNEATGELIKDEEAIKKWKERSLKQASLLKKENADSKPPAVAKKMEATRSFRTYIDLDLFTERDKVLNSFDVKIDGK